MRWVDMMSLLCHMLLVFINSRLLGFCYCCFVALFLFVVGCVVFVVVVMIYGIVFCFVYVVLFLFFLLLCVVMIVLLIML